jgi:hypothetical protein
MDWDWDWIGISVFVFCFFVFFKSWCLVMGLVSCNGDASVSCIDYGVIVLFLFWKPRNGAVAASRHRNSRVGAAVQCTRWDFREAVSDRRG